MPHAPPLSRRGLIARYLLIAALTALIGAQIVGGVVTIAWFSGDLGHLAAVAALETGAAAETAAVRPDAPAVSPWFAYGQYLIPSLLMLVVGAAIGFMRPRDRLVMQVSLLLLLLAQALSLFLDRSPFLPVWPPWTAAVSLGAARLAIYPVALLTVNVLSVFPNPSRVGVWLFRRRWILIPFALMSAESLIEILRRVLGTRILPAPLVAFLNRALPWHGLWLALLAVATVLIVAQRAGARGRGRAKLTIVQVGYVGTVLGGFAVLFLWNSATFWRLVAAPEGPVVSGLLMVLATAVPIVLLCGLPVSLGYAVVARRVFGIGLIVRRGIRYLLLSRGVIAVEAVLIFLILGEAIRYSRRAIGGSIPVAAAIAGGASLLAVLGLVRVNRPLMRRIDRRFFRERWDARRLLLDLSRRLVVLRERDEILSEVGSVLARTLHPTEIGVFLLDDGGVLAQAWSSSRASGDCASDVVETALEAFDRGADLWDAPHEASEDPADSAHGGAPADTSLEPELLVALRGTTGLLGCVALGGKRSEEPYGGEDRELLVTVATQMGFALENARLLEIARREAEQSRELSIARDVQRGLFPEALPEVADWEFAALCRPAREVGGDYYDLFGIGSERVAIALGDVAGKGVGPSLLMSGVHAVIRNRLTAGVEPEVLASELNAYLVASSAPGMYLTLFVGVLDTSDGTLRYVDCGHNPPALVTGEGEPARLSEGGTPVGLVPGAAYEAGEVRIPLGGRLVLWSDGITEAESPTGAMYDEARLFAEFAAAGKTSATGLLDSILASVERFAAGADQSDDITLVVVRRSPA